MTQKNGEKTIEGEPKKSAIFPDWLSRVITSVLTAVIIGIGAGYLKLQDDLDKVKDKLVRMDSQVVTKELVVGDGSISYARIGKPEQHGATGRVLPTVLSIYNPKRVPVVELGYRLDDEVGQIDVNDADQNRRIAIGGEGSGGFIDFDPTTNQKRIDGKSIK